MTPINHYLTQQERRASLSEGSNHGRGNRQRQSPAQPSQRNTASGGLVSRLVRALVSKNNHSRSYASALPSTQSVPGEVI